MLASIGAPATKENVAFLDAWQHFEGGTAAYNPLNTTQPAAGATRYNSQGVRNYTNAAQGIAATQATLTNGRYPHIVIALQTGNPAKAILDGKASKASLSSELRTWGTVGFANVIDQAGPGGGVSGAISSAASGANSAIRHIPGVAQGEGVVSGAVGAVSSVSDFLGKLTSLSFLLRAGEVLGGAALTAMGLFLLAKQIGLAEPVGGAVGAAVGGPAGAVAGAAAGRKPPAPSNEPAFTAPQLDDEGADLEGVADERRRLGKPLAARRVDRAGAGVETRTHSSRTGRMLEPDEDLPF